MRWLGIFALPGILWMATASYGQSLAEHAAAAAGGTIGTAAGKPISNAITSIFNKTGELTTKAGAPTPTTIEKAKKAAPADSGPDANAPATTSNAPAQPAARRARASRANATQLQIPVMPQAPYEAPAIAEPAPKELTTEDLTGIQLGTSEKDLEAKLGLPASHVTIPDDDGHLRESCQYWANGKQLGVIRLDNGQVVKIEVRSEN